MDHLHDIRVLVIPSWYPPNGGHFFKEHAMALANLGMKVDVLAGVYRSLRLLAISKIHKAFDTQSATDGNFREFKRNCWIIPFSERANFLVWINMMQQFFKQYIKVHGRPDIIIAQSAIWAGYLCSKIYKQYKIPYLVVEHRSRFVFNTPESQAMVKSWYMPFLKMTFHNATRIVTVSNSLQPFIQKCAPTQREKFISIPNMVDTDFFCPAHNPATNEPFIFFSLGSLEKVKGMDTLLEAFAILHKKFPGQFRLVIGGCGSELKKLNAFVKENNLNNFIRFEGQMDRNMVKQRMQEVHAFVLASRFEAFGVVYIEAMSCGLPVLATNAGGPKDFVEDSHGVLLESNNPEALADAMQKIRARYPTINRENIRSYAVKRFSKETVATQYLSLIQQILKKDLQKLGDYQNSISSDHRN